MVLPIIAAAAIPAIASAIQYDQGSEERRKAREAQKKALEGFTALDGELPDYITDMPEDPYFVDPGHMEYQAADYSGIQFDPVTGEAIHMGPSAMEGIALDPSTRAAQEAALLKLQGLSETGMDDVDMARLVEIQNRVGMQERGSREAIMQNMAERGIRGSGLELAAQLSNNQAAAQQAQSEALNVNAQAQQRALEALMNSGQMAGQMRSQDFAQEAQIAQASDAIKKFNAQQSTAMQNQNLANQNQAKMLQYQQDMQAAQEAADAQNMTGLSFIDSQKYSNQMAQNQFGNQMNKINTQNALAGQEFQDKFQQATGQAGAQNQMAQNINQQQNQQAQMVAGIGSGISQGITGYMDYSQKQDELDWKKKNGQGGY